MDSQLLLIQCDRGSLEGDLRKKRSSTILPVDILWTIVGIVVACLISAAGSVLGYTPPEFTLARTCLWASAIILGLTDMAWHVQTSWSTEGQLAVAVPIWASILIGVPVGLRWINRREAVYISSLKNSPRQGRPKLFDGSGREVTRDEPTRGSVMRWVAAVGVAVIMPLIITGRVVYQTRNVPLSPRVGRTLIPPFFANDHTPQSTIPPKETVQKVSVRIDRPRLDAPDLRVGGILSVRTYCRNISSTSIPAREMFCPSKFWVVAKTKGEVSSKDEEIGYRDFESSLPSIRPKKGEGPTIFPPEAQYGINTATLDERSATLLNSGQGTVIVCGLASFKDDAGRHRTESCYWLHSPINEQPRVWSVCRVHSGIRY